MPITPAAFRPKQLGIPDAGPDRARGSRLTPTMRAALDDLEREFAELMSRNRAAQRSAEVEQRADVARRLLEISDPR